MKKIIFDGEKHEKFRKLIDCFFCIYMYSNGVSTTKMIIDDVGLIQGVIVDRIKLKSKQLLFVRLKKRASSSNI